VQIAAPESPAEREGCKVGHDEPGSCLSIGTAETTVTCHRQLQAGLQEVRSVLSFAVVQGCANPKISNRNLTEVSKSEIVLKCALSSDGARLQGSERTVEFTMNHADIIQLIFGIFLGVLLSLVAANFAVIVASLSRHEEVARSITRFLSNYLWLLRMGGDADPGHRDLRKHA
jgi:hypothetical protein